METRRFSEIKPGTEFTFDLASLPAILAKSAAGAWVKRSAQGYDAIGKWAALQSPHCLIQSGNVKVVVGR